MNPYRVLHKRALALLVAEKNLPPEERKNIEWILSYTFHGVKFVLGKGDVNTMFYQFGDSPRKINYPDEIIALLDRLGSPSNKYVLYKSKAGLFTSRKAAFKKSDSIVYGITSEGKTIAAYRKVATLDGSDWEPMKEKK